jgi:hypothetical protein
MNKQNIQTILSILDTIHDYGDTGRVKTVISKKDDNQEFNPAFIIDFLMLGYVHNHFRDLLNHNHKIILNKNQIVQVPNISVAIIVLQHCYVKNFIFQHMEIKLYSDLQVQRIP